jgi:hypothetical protein
MIRMTTTGLRTPFIASLLALAAPCALAQQGDSLPGFLRGEYGFTTTQNCVRTPFMPPSAAGFDPATRKLLVAGEVAQAAGSGVMEFDREGIVTVTAGGTEVVESQLAPGQTPVIPGTEYTCIGSYVVYPDSQVTVSLPSCVVKNNTPGVTVTVGPLELEGYVGKGRNTIHLSLLAASIQTVAVTAGGNVLQKRERICTQSLSLTRL